MALIKLNTKSLADTVNLGRRNLIINGDMRIAQRGTSSTSDSYRTIDRFRNNHAGGVTQSQESLTSSDTPYTLGFRNFYRQTVTSTSTSTAQNVQIFQPIEAQNVANSGWNYTSPTSYITCSFWVRSSLAGTYNIELRTYDGTGQLYASDFTIVADTWTKIEKTVPGNSNITINNDNGQGLQFNVIAHYGTDFTDSGHTMDAWAPFNGSSRRTDMAQSWINTASATFDVTGVQVEVNDTATPFEYRSYGEELQLCKRYFQKYNYDQDTASATTANTLPVNCCYTSGIAYGGSPLQEEMRTSPTFSGSAASDWVFYTASSSYTPSEMTAYETGPFMWGMKYATSGTWTAGNAVYGRPTGTGRYYQFDAEF